MSAECCDQKCNQGRDCPNQSTGFRPSFASTYTVPKGKLNAKQTTPRLLDCMVFFHDLGEGMHDIDPQQGEFAVIDTKKKQRAFFGWPLDYSSADVHRMVESFFGQRAYHISGRNWIV